jgi:hypothetical protein
MASAVVYSSAAHRRLDISLVAALFSSTKIPLLVKKTTTTNACQQQTVFKKLHKPMTD